MEPVSESHFNKRHSSGENDNNNNNEIDDDDDFSRDEEEEPSTAAAAAAAHHHTSNLRQNHNELKQLSEDRDSRENLFEHSSNNFGEQESSNNNYNTVNSNRNIQQSDHQPTHADYIEHEPTSDNEEAKMSDDEQPRSPQRLDDQERLDRSANDEQRRFDQEQPNGSQLQLERSSRLNGSSNNLNTSRQSPAPMVRNSRPSSKQQPGSAGPGSPLMSQRGRGGGDGDGTSRSKMSTSRSLSHTLFAQHQHVNDTKYLGAQLMVGKPDPTLKSPFETKFMKMYEKKIPAPNTSEMSTEDMLSQFKRKRDPTLLANKMHYLSNELKFSGDQFKVGKPDTKAVPEFEKKFQKRFEKTKKALMVDLNTAPSKTMSYKELQAIHTAVSVDNSTYRKKK
jgi:hypothetical protein